MYQMFVWRLYLITYHAMKTTGTLIVIISDGAWPQDREFAANCSSMEETVTMIVSWSKLNEQSFTFIYKNI